ncbi:MAG: hypothetical protein DSY43_00675 [Gammaproteobacteria bacterium]|nr:MAG: hypothetical protein DSY43_00675 [Gammaproteobacteria bacterium]
MPTPRRTWPSLQYPPIAVHRNEALIDALQPVSKNEDKNEVAFATFLDRQNRLTEILSEQHQRSLLPPLTLSTFTNDPADFITFMSNFESQIESNVQSNEVRLRYLEQYLEGEAKDLIKGCQFKDPELGYPEAKKLLKDKYGDPYKISNAYIKKAAEWPVINYGNDAELDHLSTFLTQCVSAMESIAYLHILDHPQNLQNLMRKLPTYLQDRWRRQVINIRASTDRLPGFKNFADFLRIEAKIATDPVFSKQALAKSTTRDQQARTTKVDNYQRGRTYRVTSHAINAESSATSQASSKCMLCKVETHDLDDCKCFKEKTLADRKKFLAEKQLCYGCYKPGHRSRGCIQKKECTVCKGRHPTGLHDYNFTARPRDKPEEHQVNSTAVEHVWSQLPIVPVKLQYKDHHIKTYAMLDSCSTGTFITDNIRKQLKAEGNNTKILVGTVNGRALHDTKVITGLKVSDLDDKQVIELPRTFTRDEIPASESNIPQRELVRNWQHLKKIADCIPDRLQDSRVGLLIGTNCPKAMEPKDVVPCPGNGPYAVLTFAGWTVVGPCRNTVQVNRIDCNCVAIKEPSTVKPSTHHVHFVSSAKEVITPKALNNMMDLEFSERKDTSELAYSQDDNHFLKILRDGIKKENGHYIMPLPFRRDEVFMPNNKEQAISRAMSLKKRLTNDQKMYADYLKFMEDILDKDYARKVPSTVTAKAGKTWYLPHHGVYHPHKPEKIRVVFDCSARFGEVSLNNELLQGPDLTSSLVGVLTRFRKEPVAFQADIESMFHQVRVSEEHRDFLRFLWWPKGDLSQNLEEYQMNVHLFGAVSSPSCANFAVQRTADETEAQVGKETADVLRRNFYVDDCLRSEESDKKAIERVHDTIHACKEGGFHLTKISSNSRRVLETIPEDERSKEVKGIYLSFDNLPVERALSSSG